MTVATGGPPPVTLCRVGVARTMGGVSGGADTECACAPLVRDTRGLAMAPPTSALPPLLVLRNVSLWLEIRRLISPLDVSDIEDIESRGSSSPLQSGMVIIKVVIDCSKTHLILMRTYLSGMSPSLPPTQPRHQSELAWLYRTMLSPFMKLTWNIVIIIITMIIIIHSPLAVTEQ